MANLNVTLGPLKLQNPVVAASGTFGYGLEYEELMDINALGAIVVKGLSPKPIQGNPPPRIVETASGMLNSIGLQNIGVDAFIQDKLPLLRKYDRVKILANIYGHEIADYVEVAEKLDDASDVAGLEINVSCPNVKEGGLAFGTDPKVVARLTKAVRRAYHGFLMVKLTPNVTDVVEIALAAQDGGADAVSLINTLTGMSVDIEKKRPVLGNVFGGLSGPAIKPVALRMTHQVVQSPAIKIPVMGIGGIMTGKDALEFLMLGASAVQVGTANFSGPNSCIKIIEQISQWLDEKQIQSVDQWIGCMNS